MSASSIKLEEVSANSTNNDLQIAPINLLPTELIVYIFSLLSMKEQIVGMRTCKEWHFNILELIKSRYLNILRHTLNFFYNGFDQENETIQELLKLDFSSLHTTNGLHGISYAIETTLMCQLKRLNYEDREKINGEFDENQESYCSLLKNIFDNVRTEWLWLDATDDDDYMEMVPGLKEFWDISNDRDIIEEEGGFTYNFKLIQVLQELIDRKAYQRAFETFKKMIPKREDQTIRWQTKAFEILVKACKEDIKNFEAKQILEHLINRISDINKRAKHC